MKNNNQNRRTFLKTSAAGLAAAALFRNVSGEVVDGDDVYPYLELVEATIGELQAKMKAGKLTSRQLTKMYLARIAKIDVKTQAILELNPQALAIADELDRERRKGKIRGSLHGIPVLIKDNIETADRMHTTAGSFALLDAPTPKHDAFVADKLRKAGAIILGKTNLSEWANFRSTKSISGWSGRGLQTNNPYFLTENPCGSSSGSGVSVSANLAAAAVGTETNGSIICPSNTNGIVGIKPTLGLISRSGIIPIAHTQDTAGPMTRTVTDAAIMLSAMAGSDQQDPATADADKKAEKDYTKFLDANGLKGARLGVVMQFITRPDTKAYFQTYLDKLQGAGATLIDVTFTPDYNKLGEDRLNVLLYEFKADLNKYLAARGSKYKTLAELIKFNDDNKDREMPLFGQEIFTLSQAKGDLTEKAYIDALARVKTSSQKDGIDVVIAKHKLDALVTPTGGSTWAIAATAGYPYITVPLGLREIPASKDAAGAEVLASAQTTGMAFFGSAWSEPSLIKYAFAFEQITKGRVAPQFLLTYGQRE